MLHPHTEVRFINEIVGRGVFATRFIPKGTVVWVNDALDRRFTEAEVQALPDECRRILETYCYRDSSGHWIFCWDNTRFINHSSRPTCILTPYLFELAVTDIPPGGQLTNDYGFFNIIEPFECLAEFEGDRTVILPDDLLRFAPDWDAQLAEAFRFFNLVEQPLRNLIGRDFLSESEAVAAGHRPPRSIRECYCPI